MQRIRDYCLALLVCVTAYAMYSIAIVPILEPAAAEPIEFNNQSPPMTPLNPVIARLFPADAWQLAAPKQLASEGGMILFANSEQVSAQEWKLWPVTFVAHGGEDSRILVLDAPEGAKFQFSGPMDALTTDQSPIAGGQLLGNVRVISPPSHEGADDAIDAQASNVWINKREIKTADAVRLKLGSAEAVGRDLTIYLSGTSGGVTPAIDRMELIYLDHLEMPLETGLWKPIGNASAQKGLAKPDSKGPELLAANLPAPPEPSAKLRIDCKGRLEFNFQTLTLLLQGQQVHVIHQIDGYPEDSIRCQRLEMRLYNPEIPMADRPKWASVVRRIEAIGTPVTLHAPSLLSHARSEKLLIDFEHSRHETAVELSGRSTVELGHRGMVWRVPSLTYRFSHHQPERLGTLLSTGGGTLTAEPSPEMLFRSLTWKGRIQILPEKDSHLLWMDGGVDGQASDGGTMHAESIHFWFAQLLSKSENENQEMTLRPERLRLTGNVDFALTQLAAKQDSIDLWFKQVPLPAVVNEQSSAINLNRASGLPLHSWVQEPKNQPGQFVRSQPPTLLSQTLSGEISLAGQTVVGYDLSARRNVQLQYDAPAPNGTRHIEAQGDDLRVVDSPENSVLQISGIPARIGMDDGFVQGPMIQANLRDNYLWIDRDGEIRIPTALLEPAKSAASAGTPVPSAWRWTNAPSIRFRGQLVFNGLTMEANTVELSGSGRAELTGPIWQFATRCDMLRLTMDQPVNFRQLSAQQQSAVQLISLIGAVAVDASSWLEETRESRHRLELPQLDLEPQTGLLSGMPGQYRMWALRSSSAGGSLPKLMGDAPLMTAHLIYHQQMRGDLNAKRLDFNRAVRVGMGPAESWEQSLNVAKIEVPTPGQAIIDCDQLSIYQTPGSTLPSNNSQQMPWEIAGTGGVAFRGHAEAGIFSGTCNRFNYASLKDLLTLEGQPTAPAVFVRQLPSGAPGGVVKAFSMSVRPRNLEVVDFQLQGANFSNLQEGFNLPPAAQADPGSRRGKF